MTMSEKFEQIGEIRETHSLAVSARGDGLCLYLPKKLCMLYGILAGDRIKVQLREHYRLKMPVPTVGPNCAKNTSKGRR